MNRYLVDQRIDKDETVKVAKALKMHQDQVLFLIHYFINGLTREIKSHCIRRDVTMYRGESRPANKFVVPRIGELITMNGFASFS